MVEARPCSVCGVVFQPHPRVGERQKACSRTECQRERHRRNCAAWHELNPGYDRERRLRARVVRNETSTSSGQEVASDPLAQIRWKVVRDAVAPEWGTVLEEVLVHVVQWVRDAVGAQAPKAARSRRPGGPGGARDAFARGGVPP
jgi:hypothetical protein